MFGWKACTEVLVRLVVDDPRCVGVGTFLCFYLRGVLYMDEHSFLDSSRLAVNLLMHNAELVGVHGMASGGTVLVYWGGGLEMFLDSVT